VDSVDVELLTPTPYVEYLNQRDEESGYDEDNELLTLKRFRRFRIHYGTKECRAFFIDDFCERCEKAYGGFVNQYSKKVVDIIKEQYGSYIDIDRDIAVHSEVESHSWDDDDDDEFYAESTTVYVMVVHTYKLKLKEGKHKNQFKLKHPELSSIGLFNGDYSENEEKIKEWFNKVILQQSKDSIDDKRIVNALRKKAGIEHK